MVFRLTLETEKLNKQLADLASKCGLELGPIIKEEAKYLVTSAISTAPPPSRKSGEKTLKTDIKRVVSVLNYRTYEQNATEGGFYKSLARYVRERNTEKIRALIRNPNFKMFENFEVIDSVSKLHERHYSKRGNDGRVRQRPDAVAYSADFKTYYNDIKNRVGWMISGWNKAASVVGAKKKVFANKSYSNSREVVDFDFNRNPYFLAKNSNIRIPSYSKEMEYAVKYRLRIAEKKISLAEQKLAINLGFTRLAKGSY